MDTLPELLAAFTHLLNAHGPNSEEVENFLRIHEDNEELVELAELSRTLKQALTSPNPHCLTT